MTSRSSGPHRGQVPFPGAAEPTRSAAVWLPRHDRQGAPVGCPRGTGGAVTDGRAVEDLVVSRLRSAPVAPLAGRLLGSVTEGGRHHELLDSLVCG